MCTHKEKQQHRTYTHRNESKEKNVRRRRVLGKVWDHQQLAKKKKKQRRSKERRALHDGVTLGTHSHGLRGSIHLIFNTASVGARTRNSPECLVAVAVVLTLARCRLEDHIYTENHLRSLGGRHKHLRLDLVRLLPGWGGGRLDWSQILPPSLSSISLLSNLYVQ